MDIQPRCRMQHRGPELQSKLYIIAMTLYFGIPVSPIIKYRGWKARTSFG